MTAEIAAHVVSHFEARSPEDSDDDATCAICFEIQPPVKLPCQCRIHYCASCWDRALATSVTVRGRAQCPSCRTGFHIEFNQEAACLEYSKEEMGMTVSDWRSCLYGKARPVQIRLLKDFGSILKTASASNMTSEVSPAAPSLEKNQVSLSAREDSSISCKPFCICGGVLENIDSRARVIRLLEETEPGWRTRVVEAEQCIESLISSSLITCDLCDESAIRSGAVWTCKKGPHTLLHPSAYDVCESCFSCYAGSKELPALTAGSPKHRPNIATDDVSHSCPTLH